MCKHCNDSGITKLFGTHYDKEIPCTCRTPQVGETIYLRIFEAFNQDPFRKITKMGHYCKHSDSWQVWVKTDYEDCPFYITWDEKWKPIN